MIKKRTLSRKRSVNTHAQIRADHSSEVAEDYVEAIHNILAKSGECRAVDLRRQFEVSHVTVKRTLERLERDGLVVTTHRGPVALTQAGKNLAKASAERHAIVIQHLLSLGVSPATAAVDAEGIEHHVSAETLAAMQTWQAKLTGGNAMPDRSSE